MLQLSSRSVRQKCDARGTCLNDRISQLPDEILGVILSMLTQKEAMGTSILSRRWRYMWTYTACSFNFSAEKRMGRIMDSESSLEVEMIAYIRGVTRVLKLHRGHEIDQLRICFSLNASNNRDVDKWISFVIRKKVRRLELDFTTTSGCGQSNPYSFPSVQVLTSTCSTPFVHLKSLCLRNLSVTKEVLDYVLTNCSSLEQLCVGGSHHLSDLKVVGPSLKLKYLELYRCKPLENLEISAPNLVTFVYSGPKEMVPFKDVPLLSELCIHDHYCYDFIFESHRHLSYLSQLEKLHLTIPPEVVRKSPSFPHEFPKLPNLKQLELVLGLARGYPLFCYTSLIKASPSLLRFALKLLYFEAIPAELKSMMARRGDYQRALTKHSHQCLKFVEFNGFYGHQTDFELAMHLLEIAAVSLERITIDTCRPNFFGYERFAKSRGNNEAAKECARKLEAKLPPGAELVIL